MGSTSSPTKASLENLPLPIPIASRGQRYWTAVLDIVFLDVFAFAFGVFIGGRANLGRYNIG